LADMEPVRGTDEISRGDHRKEGSGQLRVHRAPPLISIE
jgi:hypothetical protein